jgi:hypothetical protein
MSNKVNVHKTTFLISFYHVPLMPTSTLLSYDSGGEEDTCHSDKS